MLKGTEEKLALNLAKALKVENEQGRKLWGLVASELIEHFTKHAEITGTCPPNGGPLQIGKLN